MKELLRLLKKASKAERKALAEVTDSGFGSAPGTLVNHVKFLRGGPIGQVFQGDSWKQVVTDVADKVGIDWPVTLKRRKWRDLPTGDIEAAVVAKVFDEMMGKLPLDRQRVLAEAKSESDRHGLEGFAVAGASMALAKASGFGVYLMASTTIGGITGAMGVTLPFAFYTTMSQAIALAIGPVGWLALGGGLIFALNQPNWQKLTLTVACVACMRYRQEHG